MSLYPKKLRNIEDLERERKLLQKERKRIEEEGFLSMDGIFSSNGKETSNLGSLIDLLPISNPLVTMLLKMVQQKFTSKNDSTDAGPERKGTKEKKDKSPLKSVAKEVIGSYLKWKAIELSYKGIRHLLKKRKEKRANSK